VLEHRTEMRVFNFYSVPTILQNYNNINFNIVLRNKYYLPTIFEDQRPIEIVMYSETEIDLIIKHGVKLMQQHTNESLKDPLDKPNVFSNNKETQQQRLENEQIKDYCFIMKDLRWNIHNKEIYQINNNQPLAAAFKDHTHIDHINNVSEHNNNIWLGDSGASCHFTNDDKCMFECRNIRHTVGTGDGGTIFATKEGKHQLKVLQCNGDTSQIVLTGCKYIPSLPTNLFSITSALQKGLQLSNVGVHIQLSKNEQQIVFDTIDKTTRGVLVTVEMQPIIPFPTTNKRNTIERCNDMRQPTAQQMLDYSLIINNTMDNDTQSPKLLH
jgi:hypothetical protein